jgi:hypothetical protein
VGLLFLWRLYDEYRGTASACRLMHVAAVVPGRRWRCQQFSIALLGHRAEQHSAKCSLFMCKATCRLCLHAVICRSLMHMDFSTRTSGCRSCLSACQLIGHHMYSAWRRHAIKRLERFRTFNTRCGAACELPSSGALSVAFCLHAAAAAEPAPAAKPSKKKEKKGKKDMSSLFAALGEDGEAPAGAQGGLLGAAAANKALYSSSCGRARSKARRSSLTSISTCMRISCQTAAACVCSSRVSLSSCNGIYACCKHMGSSGC